MLGCCRVTIIICVPLKNTDVHKTCLHDVKHNEHVLFELKMLRYRIMCVIKRNEIACHLNESNFLLKIYRSTTGFSSKCPSRVVALLILTRNFANFCFFALQTRFLSLSLSMYEDSASCNQNLGTNFYLSQLTLVLKILGT